MLGVAALPAGLALAAQTQTVVASGTSYTPKTLTIAAGDSVTWTNPNAGFHGVAFDDNSFSASPTSSATITTHEFDTPGTFTYHCQIHGGLGMTGTLVVTGAGTTPTPTATPTVTPTPSATPTPTPTSTPTYALPTVRTLRVFPRVIRGRVRGFVRATPSLQRVRVSATPGGHVIVRAKARLRKTPYAVKLDRATRRAVRRGRHPRVTFTARAGASVRSRTVRLRR